MIGRKAESEKLIELYNRNSFELVAIYGRRRVGKTYLVDEVFSDKLSFRHAGLSPVETGKNEKARPLKQQLQAFYYSLLSYGMKKSHCPKDWLEAFFMLEMFLQEKDDGSRQVIFLDELPWMDTNKSGFITAFEAFCNGWASHRKNVMVVVCGSANSWILDKLINDQGGLYDRVTYEMHLEPFSLKECEDFLKERGTALSRYDIVQSYMLVGGVPYYLNYLQKGKSLSQSIDSMFFEKNAQLKDEYRRLFASTFKNPDKIQKIVEVLSKRSSGFTRNEISEKAGISNGGTLTEMLSALIASDFIMKYVPFGLSKMDEHYKLIDPFCIFYLKFVKNRDKLDGQFWQQNTSSNSISSWRGYAFENVCFNHIHQIKTALGIPAISSEESAWSKKADDEEGAQIDLIIVRKDNVVNMCEIKFYGDEFVVNNKYERTIRNRQMLISNMVNKKSIVHNTLISTYGLKANEYSSIFDNVITLDDLFM
ncbi:hypothetical protein SAMN05421493_105147 [Pseudobutyrivibrio sp. 49]|uniref:AAA family ATPase n=1 Tax=Pseudobutyrivibrio sp. 49 TaxID=1855344 RepID=UPI00088FF335|nr:ATP-binding protein [Pseudobutyrivibrio sp. 49]SDH92132.1 hypothetical protein SAMN05421493_105147 [Pseudobutyrivibrio sp. 49]